MFQHFTHWSLLSGKKKHRATIPGKRSQSPPVNMDKCKYGRMIYGTLSIVLTFWSGGGRAKQTLVCVPSSWYVYSSPCPGWKLSRSVRQHKVDQCHHFKSHLAAPEEHACSCQRFSWTSCSAPHISAQELDFKNSFTSPHLIYWLILKCWVPSLKKTPQSEEDGPRNHNNTWMDILDQRFPI